MPPRRRGAHVANGEDAIERNHLNQLQQQTHLQMQQQQQLDKSGQDNETGGWTIVGKRKSRGKKINQQTSNTQSSTKEVVVEALIDGSLPPSFDEEIAEDSFDLIWRMIEKRNEVNCNMGSLEVDRTPGRNIEDVDETEQVTNRDVRQDENITDIHVDIPKWMCVLHLDSLNSRAVQLLEQRSKAFEPMYLYSMENSYFLLPEAAKVQHNIRIVNINISTQHFCFRNRIDLNVEPVEELVNVYVKFGFLHEALLVFDKMPQKDNIAWKSILRGFVDTGQFLVNTPQGILEISSGLLRRHNIYNILAAVAVGIAVFLIKNWDTGKEFIVKGYGEDGMWNMLSDLQTGKQLTMDEFEKCVGYSPVIKELMRRQNVRGMHDDKKLLGSNYLSKSMRGSKRRGAALLKNIKGVANSMNLRHEKEKEGNGSTPVPSVPEPETVLLLSEKPVCSFQGHQNDVLDLSWFRSQPLLSSSMDKTVRLWDLESKTCLKLFAHNDSVTCRHFNPMDDNYFLTGSLDAKVRISSILNRQVIDWSDLHGMVTAARYTPDGQGAVIGTHKENCRMFNTEDGKLSQLHQMEIQNQKKGGKKVTGFLFSPVSPTEYLVTSADSRIRILNGNDVIHKFKGFSLRIAVSFTVPTVATCVFHLVRSWSLSKSSCLIPHRGKVQSKTRAHVVDESNTEVMNLQMRDSSKTKQVVAITKSDDTHTFAEFNGTKWSLMYSDGCLQLQTNVKENGCVLELIGNRMLKIFPGRKLDFESKHCGHRRVEQDFKTVVEFSANFPYVKVVALLDLKTEFLKAEEEWFVVPGITLAFILSDILRKGGIYSGLIIDGNSLTFAFDKWLEKMFSMQWFDWSTPPMKNRYEIRGRIFSNRERMMQQCSSVRTIG